MTDTLHIASYPSHIHSTGSDARAVLRVSNVSQDGAIHAVPARGDHAVITDAMRLLVMILTMDIGEVWSDPCDPDDTVWQPYGTMRITRTSEDCWDWEILPLEAYPDAPTLILSTSRADLRALCDEL